MAHAHIRVVPGAIDATFIALFNRELEALSSQARVELPDTALAQGMIELQDDEGRLICFIPADTSPKMAAITYRISSQAFTRGVRAGEAAAWDKLRYLIGAAAAA